MHVTLVDGCEGFKETVNVKVELGTNYAIDVIPEGFGNATMTDGHGVPVILELWEGRLRLLVWADINQEDPTHIIDLEGAREDKRKE